MKLSDFKGEKALDVLADILEPAVEIMADAEVKNTAKEKGKVAAISYAIKNHKTAIIKIMAVLDDTPVEEYEVNILTLPAKLLELLNDEDVAQLFTSQSQQKAVNSSGSASENIKGEKM